MSSPAHGEVRARHYATRQAMRLKWQAGLISSIEPVPDTALDEERWIAPTLFDVQVNGFGGVDFQQDQLSDKALLAAVRALRAAGCSRFLLTLVTDDWTRLTARLRHLKTLRTQSPELQSAIVGWHIEGPFLSTVPGFHGAHDPALMLDPTPKHIQDLRALTAQDPCLLTLSPERPGALPAISEAVSLGLKVSLGHTNASAEVLREAIAAGATGFTHLGNGCPRDLDRHDNILWRVFEQPGLTVSLIPDQIHVSPMLFRLVHRVLDPANVFYTSDAMSAAGMPPGVYSLGKLRLEVGADQVVRQPGKSLFAGSALRPIDGVFRSAKMLGAPWQEIWARFSEAPARFLGLRNELAIGQPADFCLLKLTAENELADLRIGG